MQGILDNLETILGIELLVAAQAYDLRTEGVAMAGRTGKIYAGIRAVVPFYRDDRPMRDDFGAIRTFMRNAAINQGVD